jgi:hypothetical protein
MLKHYCKKKIKYGDKKIASEYMSNDCVKRM